MDYSSSEELPEADFGGQLSPVDLKTGVSDGIWKTLQPVRDYFEEHPENYERLQEIVAGLSKLR